MEEEKFQSKNLIHPSIDDYLLLKTIGEHDNGQEKILKILFYRGSMTKGEYGKGYYGIWFWFVVTNKLSFI